MALPMMNQDARVCRPIGFPLFCFQILRYYNVPKIAARKIKRAETCAFLQHCAWKLARAGKALAGIDECIELEQLSHTQRRYLVELFLPANAATTDSTTSNTGQIHQQVTMEMQSLSEIVAASVQVCQTCTTTPG